MSSAGIFDRQMLQLAIAEVETVRQSLPESTLVALAQEVVHRVSRNLSRPIPEAKLSTQDVDALCVALLSDDPDAALIIVEKAQDGGSSYQAICVAYLGVAAQRLGEWWDNDQISFYRVTVAAGRIYAILRVLRMNRLQSLPDLRRTAVFASVPGENHTLGITIAADLARDRGWDIELFVGLPHDDLVEKFETRRPAVIGLSASGRRSTAALSQLIVALRIINPSSRILVCGQIVTSNISLVGVTGADAEANDFESAIFQMERLLKR